MKIANSARGKRKEDIETATQAVTFHHNGCDSHQRSRNSNCQRHQNSNLCAKSDVGELFIAFTPPANIHRLYITNLPSSKIRKSDLRISLYTLFSTYGAVLDVVSLRTMKMRGQAHVVYRDVQTATQAMRALQGFEFFGREMVSSSLPQ
jgi:RNA recognition motif-containing protein